MKYSLTVALITSRDFPRFDWFLDSLCREIGDRAERIIVVDSQKQQRPVIPTDIIYALNDLVHVEPIPNVWQGPSRVTKGEWWATASSRNSAFCHCETDWIWMLDDRSVILPGAFESIKAAMEGNYAVCGAYEKRTGITVESGVIKHAGIITGKDSRQEYCSNFQIPTPFKCPGEWMFGCNFALPLEWALEVNGQDEMTNGIGMDDVIFGMHLANNGKDIRYEPRLKIIEDRTPGETGPVMRREDKGVSPNDKSHSLLEKLRYLKRSTNQFDIRELRAKVLRGEPLPIPTEPKVDFWDGQPISEFV